MKELVSFIDKKIMSQNNCHDERVRVEWTPSWCLLHQELMWTPHGVYPTRGFMWTPRGVFPTSSLMWTSYGVSPTRSFMLCWVGHLHTKVWRGLRLHQRGVRVPAIVPLLVGCQPHIRVSSVLNQGLAEYLPPLWRVGKIKSPFKYQFNNTVLDVRITGFLCPNINNFCIISPFYDNIKKNLC